MVPDHFSRGATSVSRRCQATGTSIDLLSKLIDLVCDGSARSVQAAELPSLAAAFQCQTDTELSFLRGRSWMQQKRRLNIQARVSARRRLVSAGIPFS